MPDIFGEKVRPYVPPIQLCEVCGRLAVFGHGPPLVRVERWWCAAIRPADFYTYKG